MADVSRNPLGSLLWVIPLCLLSVYSFVAVTYLIDSLLLLLLLEFTFPFLWTYGLLKVAHVAAYLERNPAVRLFEGYGAVRKTSGAALVFLGNILVYYKSEKSVACLLAFWFLARTWLSLLGVLQPCTDFGVLDFLLSATLNVALSLFGLGIYTWLVSAACIAMMAVHYCNDLMEDPMDSMDHPIDHPMDSMDHTIDSPMDHPMDPVQTPERDPIPN